MMNKINIINPILLNNHSSVQCAYYDIQCIQSIQSIEYLPDVFKALHSLYL